MNLWLLGGSGLLCLWVVLVFLLQWPSGWAHLPLAVGVVLLALGIVRSDGNQPEK